jgi:hypothetical protein
MSGCCLRAVVAEQNSPIWIPFLITKKKSLKMATRMSVALSALCDVGTLPVFRAPSAFGDEDYARNEMEKFCKEIRSALIRFGLNSNVCEVDGIRVHGFNEVEHTILLNLLGEFIETLESMNFVGWSPELHNSDFNVPYPALSGVFKSRVVAPIVVVDALSLLGHPCCFRFPNAATLSDHISSVKSFVRVLSRVISKRSSYFYTLGLDFEDHRYRSLYKCLEFVESYMKSSAPFQLKRKRDQAGESALAAIGSSLAALPSLAGLSKRQRVPTMTGSAFSGAAVRDAATGAL